MSRAPITPTGTWNVDPAHSRVGWSVRHLGISTVHGSFKEFDGTLEVGDDISSAKARGTAQVNSIDTGQPDRDRHLLSSDFFDGEAHPQITFESTSIEPTADDQVTVTGNLTVLGTTKEIVLTAHIGGIETDPFGAERVGLEVHGEIDRTDFGMKFNIPLDSGIVAMSETVQLNIDISAIKAA